MTSRTTCFTVVEPDENKHDTDNDKHESNKVELGNVLFQGLAMMRVQVEEEEQNCERNSSSRSRIKHQ